MQERITAMANGVCDATIRAASASAAPTPLGALANGQRASGLRVADHPACPAAGEQPKSNVVIRVIAEQTPSTRRSAATTAAPSATPTARRRRRCCSGHGVLPNCAAGRSDPQRRHHQTDPHPGRRTRAALPAHSRAGRIRADAGSVLPLPGLRRAGRRLRHRPRPTLALRPHPRLELQLQVPKTPPAENLLDRRRGPGRRAATRPAP